MRLACPNCGAEYEVPDGLVPEGGKHVQCTDCDTRWFVRGGRDAVISENQLIERLENWRPRLVTAGGAPPAPAATRPVAEPEPEPEAEPAPRAPVAAPEAETGAAPAGRSASASDTEAPEDIPDLTEDGPPEDFVWEDSQGAVAPPQAAASGIPTSVPPPPPAPPAAAPMFQPVREPEPVIAPGRPEDPAGPDASEPARPEVGRSGDDAEIEAERPIRNRNRSSHRIELPEADARAVETPGPAAEPGRFRTGVTVGLALFAVALLVYAARDAIVAAVPAVEPALSGYARVVDGMRQGIDRIIAPDG